MELESHYRDLSVRLTIITGADDQIVDEGRQSQRLHLELPQSEFIVLPELGHMVHHLAPNEVATAIEDSARWARE